MTPIDRASAIQDAASIAQPGKYAVTMIARAGQHLAESFAPGADGPIGAITRRAIVIKLAFLHTTGHRARCASQKFMIQQGGCKARARS
jgi:hypothetical protein